MLIKIFKILIALFLIFYFINTDRINVDKLILYKSSPSLIFFLFVLFVLFVIPLMSVRLWLLLRAMDIALPFRRVYSLIWIGNFFNTFLPGSVSGDIIKFVYIKKEKHEATKTRIISILLYDRIIGLSALISISILALLIESAFLNTIDIYFSSFIFSLSFFLFLFFAFNFANLDRFTKIKSVQSLLQVKLFASLFQLATLLNNNKKTLFQMFLLSILLQLGVILFIIYISSFFGVDLFWQQLIIIPIGLIITALPITPAGLGTGHAGFAGLYLLFGNANGADIFNVFVIGQICMYLFGIVPFILNKDVKLKSVNDKLEI